MEDAAKLISAIAALAWPLVLAILLFKLFGPIRALVDSALRRKFSIKVAGNELTMEEVSEQQRVIVSDLQSKVAELERRLDTGSGAAPAPARTPGQSAKRVLWVDDNPRNNSLLAASIEERGARVDIALSTEEAMDRFRRQPYDIVLSDMGRPEGEKAGIDLTQRVKALNPATPVFIYCGSWAARHLREEALGAGATQITSSASTLLSALPLASDA
jgi:CheY-like chemotaxis protein